MVGSFSTKTYLALALGLLFSILSVVVVVLVNSTMRRLALTDSENAARMLLDHNLAVHTYFSHDLKPKLFERLGPITSKEYFEPVWMSSTYAVRKMDQYFHHFNKSPYYYKECAINARSPENEADNYEKAFLVDLQSSPQLTTKSGIRVLDGKPYFTLLRRGEAMEESCLRCHSSPEQAPGDLVRQYGPERSFHRKVEDVVQAISIRIPLSEAFSSARSFSFYLSGLLLVALGGGFLFVWVGNKRLLISPMAQIQEHAVRIASEHERLGETIPEPKVRELRDLVAAFNQMSVELRKAYEEQEQTIMERTAELSRANEQLTQEIIDRKKSEQALQKAHEELGERVKELNCLYGVSKLIERPGISLDEILQGVVDIIPRSWQYPEITCTRIILEDREFKTENVADGVWMHSADIVVYGERVGCLEVGYAEQRPERDEEPFLKQERDLLNAIAERLGRVTERMKTEEALRESEERYRRLVENLNDVIFSVNMEGTIAYISPAIERFTSYTVAELVGQPFQRFVHSEDLPGLTERYQRLLENEIVPHEYRFVDKDGSSIHIRTHSRPVYEDGRPVGLTGQLTDITDLKKAEEEREALRNQLFQAQKLEAIGTLTGGIAHDFNNLLTIINGYTELVLSEKTSNDPSYSDLQKVLETGRKGAELVQRLLALSKKGESNPQPLDLNHTVANSVALMKSTLLKMIEIETVLGKDLSLVNADAAQVDQVLMNLCINAKEAMPYGGNLRIETKNAVVDEAGSKLQVAAKPGPHVVIEVTDTGAGMDAETLDRLFDPFFTTKGWDSKKGTGLSLPVAKGIVEQHGGWMTCESELGKGTTFRLYFPAIVEAAAAEKPVPAVETVPSSEKMLLVDDEEYVRDLGKRILERAGYEVITASNGKEALDIYAREQSNIGLVILDLIMLQKSGEQCLQELYRINPDVKVVVLSGHSLASEERDHLDTLVKGFVNKPYQMREFLEVVGGVLKER